MADPITEQLRRELKLRREEQLKDLETERDVGPRPLEGFSHAHTSWTGEQDDSQAASVHGHDEERSRELSLSEVPLPEPDRELPEHGSGEEERAPKKNP